MKIKSIKKVILDSPKTYYDIVNIKDTHNFVIKTKKSYIVSHNCDEVSFQRNQDIDKQKRKALDMIDTALAGMLTRHMVNRKNKSL